MKINIMKLINRTKGRINPRYDITVLGVETIKQNSHDLWYAITNAFVFGYAQGMKAAKGKITNSKGAKTI